MVSDLMKERAVKEAIHWKAPIAVVKLHENGKYTTDFLSAPWVQNEVIGKVVGVAHPPRYEDKEVEVATKS